MGAAALGSETFKFSDPELDAKVRDIVALYLKPPDTAVVLCIDTDGCGGSWLLCPSFDGVPTVPMRLRSTPMALRSTPEPLPTMYSP
ncbi:MAG: hypothetical protein KY450_03505 [Actinobacteria bacterium]|nr:hypothetical protein [Actinomycetota bacterium]